MCPLSLRRSRPVGTLTATCDEGRTEQRAGDRNRGDGSRPAARGLTTASWANPIVRRGLSGAIVWSPKRSRGDDVARTRKRSRRLTTPGPDWVGRHGSDSSGARPFSSAGLGFRRMEIQEPSPRLLISGLRYETVSPWLLDKRGELIAHFSKKYELPDWNAQQDVVQFYTKDARTLFQLSVREVYVSIENFEDLAEATDSAQNFMSDALEALKVERISWTGTRMHWLAAADSFEELCAWFHEPVWTDRGSCRGEPRPQSERRRACRRIQGQGSSGHDPVGADEGGAGDGSVLSRQGRDPLPGTVSLPGPRPSSPE